ncbi:hypothetical protein RFI_33324, partial [Reticulomyxa filosa]
NNNNSVNNNNNNSNNGGFNAVDDVSPISEEEGYDFKECVEETMAHSSKRHAISLQVGNSNADIDNERQRFDEKTYSDDVSHDGNGHEVYEEELADFGDDLQTRTRTNTQSEFSDCAKTDASTAHSSRAVGIPIHPIPR